MALLFMDGFGGEDILFKWDPNSQGISTASASPRVPGCFYGNTNYSSIYKTFTASSKIIIGLGYSPNDNALITFSGDGGTIRHITVVRDNTTGRLQIRRGDYNGTLLATGTQQLFAGMWNYVEVSVTISDTVGEVHVRLNGSLTDDVLYIGDTKNGGTASTIDKVTINTAGGRLADVYILDGTGPVNNDFLGDVVVRTLSPSGNGNSSQLVGSDGNSTDNYLLVDEHPYSASDYVGSATVGQKDTYAMADLPAGVTTVYGVQINSMMMKSDASLAQSRLLLRSAGTDYAGITRALTTSSIGYYELYSQDPATSAAWTPAGVNGIESG
ncbi:MAG: hypothetical protein ABIR46_00680, partial [Candidatus Saccharimonadales bacterium]